MEEAGIWSLAIIAIGITGIIISLYIYGLGARKKTKPMINMDDVGDGD